MYYLGVSSLKTINVWSWENIRCTYEIVVESIVFRSVKYRWIVGLQNLFDTTACGFVAVY